MKHIRGDVGELRTDMRDVRDRLTRLEERVSHLPTKSWSIMIAAALITIGVGIVTFAPILQRWAGISSP
ncbi:hypothetical protein [Salinarimonas chemoclinalis]|uniref:hypothetical protein n=1 Tax=Salinarimonas chemoclinalis TaxID=3241599 RepID=UPI0035575E8A